MDLENKDIGESFKISSIKLPEGVTPTIQGRDFVVATLAAPTIIKEPEKPAEGTEGAEGAATTEGGEGDAKTASPEAEKGEKKDESKKGDEKKSPGEKK